MKKKIASVCLNKFKACVCLVPRVRAWDERGSDIWIPYGTVNFSECSVVQVLMEKGAPPRVGFVRQALPKDKCHWERNGSSMALWRKVEGPQGLSPPRW